MKKLDKKLLKMVGHDEFFVDYMPFITKEQKERLIKIARGKLREIERREKRILSFLS